MRDKADFSLRLYLANSRCQLFNQLGKGKSTGPGDLLPEIRQRDQYATKICRQRVDLVTPQAGVVRPAVDKNQCRAARIALYRVFAGR